MNLFVMDANGSNPRRVTEGAFQDSRPAFSPDGTMIVFLSNRDGSNRQLYVVPVDRSAPPRRLLPKHYHHPPVVFGGRQVYLLHLRQACNSKRSKSESGGFLLPGVRWSRSRREGFPNSQGLFVDPDGLHLWFHSNGVPYRFGLETRTPMRAMPPGFNEAGHVTRSRNGVITFDSTPSQIRQGVSSRLTSARSRRRLAVS